MLRARWLGRVPYGEADRLQRALHARAVDDYLLLLEHPHVYTLGTTADPAHVLVQPATVGAELADEIVMVRRIGHESMPKEILRILLAKAPVAWSIDRILAYCN